MKRLLVLSLLFTGCSSNVYLVKSDEAPLIPQKEKVYVLNPELQYEYKILKQSNIFKLSDNKAGAKVIKLNKIVEKPYFCGTPIMGTVITLGLVPTSFPDSYIFSFEIIGTDSEESVEYILPVERTYSLYETFNFFHDSKEEVIAETLRMVYAEQH